MKPFLVSFLSCLCLVLLNGCASDDYVYDESYQEPRDTQYAQPNAPVGSTRQRPVVQAEKPAEAPSTLTSEEEEAPRVADSSAASPVPSETVDPQEPKPAENISAPPSPAPSEQDVEKTEKEAGAESTSTPPPSAPSEQDVEKAEKEADTAVSALMKPEDTAPQPPVKEAAPLEPSPFDQAAAEAARRHPEIVKLAAEEKRRQKEMEEARLAASAAQTSRAPTTSPFASSQPALKGLPQLKLPQNDCQVSFLASVIYHSAGAADLNEQDMRALREIQKFHRKNGGMIRVVGHASSRTSDMDPVKQMVANLSISTRRADVVTQQLINFGVPEKVITVEGVSDSEPIMRENMPYNEALNRRTEIYISY